MGNAFDKVIGYEGLKEEFNQILDMIKNREKYEKIGATLPRGIILEGNPGLGKTLMAKCFIEESGLKAYTIRKNRGDFNFIASISKTFEEAKENAPSIILLDDMDKFANEDSRHCDAGEYVAVQAGIDDAKGKEVFVIATVNNPTKLPASLVRSGRFDRNISVEHPNEKDAEEIMKYYLKTKKMDDDINYNDLAKMMSYSSCAEFESTANEAAISAAYEGKELISMEHMIKAVLKRQYNSSDNDTVVDGEDLDKVAWHEAGHVVASECLIPESVGLSSIKTRGRGNTGGFIHRCKSLDRRVNNVVVSLAGKAAAEMHFPRCASGCNRDLMNAAEYISSGITGNATFGLSNVVAPTDEEGVSEEYMRKVELITTAELEKMYFKTREILFDNHEFLEKVHDELLAKKTLLFSDIQAIKKTCTIKEYVM